MFESQWRRDVRGAVTSEGRERVIKSKKSFEQKSEQKRERVIAAFAGRAIFSIVQVWVKVRPRPTEEGEQKDGRE